MLREYLRAREGWICVIIHLRLHCDNNVKLLFLAAEDLAHAPIYTPSIGKYSMVILRKCLKVTKDSMCVTALS
jgi:hypothetical protein